MYHFSGPKASRNPPLPLLLSLPRLLLSYDEKGTEEVEDDGIGTGIGEVVDVEVEAVVDDAGAAVAEAAGPGEDRGVLDEGEGKWLDVDEAAAAAAIVDGGLVVDSGEFEGVGFEVALVAIVRAPVVFDEEEEGEEYEEEPICDEDGPGDGGFDAAGPLYAVCALKAARKLAKNGRLVVMAADTRVWLASSDDIDELMMFFYSGYWIYLSDLVAYGAARRGV
ncbi:uncharacterized protein GIQ15_02274 [Arthroderma uncinatum]|uniref:uncharacterized protein n=1 Tax=Arthroderma uncinatum TaxID=74035 RepID=UPI00144ADE97|nr:uncharacterized protein GIQ15_02274 [Arthroderma uncinatum]KAF3482950.1 hypothetical protein GIQ15_02274 [Arthroderma uncinatum]